LFVFVGQGYKMVNPTFARDGTPPSSDVDLLADLLRCGWGEQMTYEEMMQIEEVKVAAEQKAWERLHEAILKKLFDKTDKQVLAEELAVP
jgi:hypothetical protein